LIYGIAKADKILIAANAVTFALASLTLWIKVVNAFESEQSEVIWMKHHMVTAAFLIAAILCYAAGFEGEMLLFVAAGLVFEGIFWVRVFRRRRDSK
jgi:hypothetical protein